MSGVVIGVWTIGCASTCVAHIAPERIRVWMWHALSTICLYWSLCSLMIGCSSIFTMMFMYYGKAVLSICLHIFRAIFWGIGSRCNLLFLGTMRLSYFSKVCMWAAIPYVCLKTTSCSVRSGSLSLHSFCGAGGRQCTCVSARAWTSLIPD